jgi:hypothetical protein
MKREGYAAASNLSILVNNNIAAESTANYEPFRIGVTQGLYNKQVSSR